VLESLTETLDSDERNSVAEVINKGPKISINAVTQGCLFVNASICDKATKYLIDSGSSVTIVTKKIFECIPLDERPTLQSVNMMLVTASGDKLKVIGKAELVDMCMSKKLL